MRGLLVMGLSHATAPVEVREKLAFNRHRRREALAHLKRDYPSAEAVILSTCNRVELYIAANGNGPTAEQAAAFLGAFHGMGSETFAPHLYHHDERGMVEHLFRVAASLDSMVIGESQILGQVREAYDASRLAGSAGGALNPLFQRAIAAGKQVMRQTGIGQGRLSLASVAVDCAKRIFDHFHDKTILSIGAGKMAMLMLKSLHELRPMRLLVCNRDSAKAAILAEKFAGTPAAFGQLEEHLVSADIVLTSTGSAHPIITRQQFEGLLKKRRYRPIFLIDIAMPRDVEASVGELENVYLYNIDDLQHVVGQTLSSRQEAIESARAIVEREVREFVQWDEARSHGLMIDRLFTRYHELANEQLQRTFQNRPGLSPQEQEHLRKLTRRLVNKLLHDPVQAMRHSGRAEVDQAAYQQALADLLAGAAPLPGERDD